MNRAQAKAIVLPLLNPFVGIDKQDAMKALMLGLCYGMGRETLARVMTGTRAMQAALGQRRIEQIRATNWNWDEVELQLVACGMISQPRV